MEIKNKKGSHVGFVISFVVFVTFLVFLFAVLQPAITREDTKEYVLNSLKFRILENVSYETTTVSLNVEENSGNDECITLSNIDGTGIPSEFQGNLLIKNYLGDKLNYELSGQNINVETGQNFEGILRVSYSDVLAPGQTSQSGCVTKSYSVGIKKNDSQITETGFTNLESYYDSNYDTLKSKFGVSENSEFSFTLFDSGRNEIINSEKESPPQSIDIYVSETPVKYMNSTGGTKLGFLVINVW